MADSQPTRLCVSSQAKPRANAIDADLLHRLYVDQRMSVGEIAEHLGIPQNTAGSRLLRAGVPKRSRKEAVALAIEKGRFVRQVPSTACELRDVVKCKGCGWRFRREGQQIYEPCPKCNGRCDCRLARKSGTSLGHLGAWRKDNRGDSKQRESERRKRNRRHVLQLIGDGKIECVRCGCDRIEFLEINHKNGGGTKEYERTGQTQMCYDILALRRPVNDLEICCRVCNALHFLELKHGPLPYRIEYRKETDDA